jgi:arylsulfatase A-like enzyme
VKTPNLDRLAQEGRRFTHAYAPGSVCSPTRYGLMTGRYYWRTSVKDGKVLPANSPLHIETNRLTLASLCKSQGYRTAGFGKWHLGMTTERVTDWSKPLKPGPMEIGFDYYYGMAANIGSGPHSFIENGEVTGHVPGEPIIVNGGSREGDTTTGIRKSWQPDHVWNRFASHRLDRNEPRAAILRLFAPNAVQNPSCPIRISRKARMANTATSSRSSTGAWGRCSPRSTNSSLPTTRSSFSRVTTAAW